MNKCDALIYDLEIQNPVYTSGVRLEGVTYAEGWQDFDNMAISVLVAYDCGEQMWNVYLEDNLDEFQSLVERREYVIGANSKRFDDKVCEANGLSVQTTFDFYDEIRRAAGHSVGKRIAGYGLDKVAMTNLRIGKGGDGADAPRLYREGKIGQLVTYCTRDVQLLSLLMEAHEQQGYLFDPISDMRLTMRGLFEAKHDGPQAKLL